MRKTVLRNVWIIYIKDVILVTSRISLLIRNKLVCHLKILFCNKVILKQKG